MAAVEAISWLVVPVILLALLMFSLNIISRVDEPELKASARAGFWAGLVLLVIFIVSQMQYLKEPHFEFNDVPELQVGSLVIGSIIGFLFLWTVKFLLPTRMVGLTTLLLAATSTIALYGFIFIESLRSKVLYISLGAAFGVLFHIVLFPNSIQKLWEATTPSAEQS